MYRTSFGQVVGDTASFPMTQGVKQGDPLAPFLFRCFFDEVTTYLHAALPEGPEREA